MVPGGELRLCCLPEAGAGDLGNNDHALAGLHDEKEKNIKEWKGKRRSPEADLSSTQITVTPNPGPKKKRRWG